MKTRSKRGLTLVETMVSMFILTLMLLGFLESFVMSRRVTESSVMHAAATSLVYGIVEQIKGFDYTTLVPSTAVDSFAVAHNPTTGLVDGSLPAPTPPYIRIRVNQDDIYWLQTVYTPSTLPDGTPNPTGPQAPSTLPTMAQLTAMAAGATPTAIDNQIGPLPLSSIQGTKSQNLTVHIWIWIDEIPDETRDVVQVKRVTLVYKYTINEGRKSRDILDREIFIRTRYDQ